MTHGWVQAPAQCKCGPLPATAAHPVGPAQAGTVNVTRNRPQCKPLEWKGSMLN